MLSIQGATLAKATLSAITVCEKARQAVHSWVLPAGLLVGSLVVHFCVLRLHDGESCAGTASPLPVVTLRQTAAQEAPAIAAQHVTSTAPLAQIDSIKQVDSLEQVFG